MENEEEPGERKERDLEEMKEWRVLGYVHWNVNWDFIGRLNVSGWPPWSARPEGGPEQSQRPETAPREKLTCFILTTPLIRKAPPIRRNLVLPSFLVTAGIAPEQS